MLFEEYENFVVEDIIDLTQYLSDNKESDFYNEFFNTSKAGFFEKIFSSIKESSNNTLIDKLKANGVNSVLLIFSHKFITDMFNLERNRTKIRPRDFKKEFLDKFYNKFTSSGIGCGVASSNLRDTKGIEQFAQWLNLKEIKKHIDLNDYSAYMLGFKDFAYDNKGAYESVYLKIDNNEVALNDSETILIGSSPVFKFNISGNNSIVKVSNLDGDLGFITEGIESIESNLRDLNEEYFSDNYYSDFYIEIDLLRQKDTVLKMNKKTNLTLSLTKSLQEEVLEPNDVETLNYNSEPTKTPQKENIAVCTDIEQESQERKRANYLNPKDKYIINLNNFFIPYEHNLIEVEFFLIVYKDRYTLVASSKIDESTAAIAKVVANIETKSIEVTNLSSKVLQFTTNQEKAELKNFKDVVSSEKVGMATDTDDINTTTPKIELQSSESYTFDKRVEFQNCAIELGSSAIALDFVNFAIASFNKGIKLNRHTFSIFNKGTVIDYKEMQEYASRVYANGEKKIVGTLLSRNPLSIDIKNTKAQLTNEIKEHFQVKINFADGKSRELHFNDATLISVDELFNFRNTITVQRDKTDLLNFSIAVN